MAEHRLHQAMARPLAMAGIARVVGAVLAVAVIETDQVGDKAAAPTRLATRPAHPILSVNPTSCRSVLRRAVLAIAPRPKKLL
jgi:hypothetical protein